MKTMIKIFPILLVATAALAAGKIQDADVKSLAELQAAGADKPQLINDTKIYVTANGINDQLSTAISAGTIGGNGGGGFNYLTNPSFENATYSTGWTVTTATGAAETTTSCST